MSKFDVVLVTNSPGELSALVKPVAETLHAHLKQARVILALTPCQYTSGKEIEYTRTIRGISATISADEYKRWVLRNQKPKLHFQEKGVVLYLGGDLAHAMLIARKLKYPAVAYVQEHLGWAGFYQKFFVPDNKAQLKLARNSYLKKKIKVVGNLMVDSVAGLPKWAPRKNVITFMPGSRAWQINHTTPIYEKIIAGIRAEMPDIKIQLVSSPFIKAKAIKGVKTIPFEEVQNSELVITIPGTNTARLAARGMPMIVIFPLDDPGVIPLEGIPHYIGKIPVIGIKFKQLLVETLNRKIKFFALPNIKAGKEIVPEIRGTIDPSAIAMKAIGLLKAVEQRNKMSKALIKAMGKTGAARKIVEEISDTLQKAA